VACAFWSEQLAGEGEDAEPLCLSDGPDAGLVAVFDGLGGAGGETYTTPDGPRSGAAIGAGLAREVLERAWVGAGGATGAAFAETYRAELRDAMAEAAAGLRPARRRLRSSLLKTLPTTVAAAGFRWDPGRGSGRCDVWWAGDSRVYVLDPRRGLRQVSRDDLRSGGDALANLVQDSPLSNFACAEGGFTIRHATVRLTGPHLVIVATDGCFGYVALPSAFEDLLLQALMASRTPEEWGRRLELAVRRVTGDDASMAVVALGSTDLGELKRSLRSRAELVGARFVAPLAARDAELEQLRERIRKLSTARDAVRAELLAEYRQQYEAQLPPEPR
jgi:serine/threonine protein phosphatase PrpC